MLIYPIIHCGQESNFQARPHAMCSPTLFLEILHFVIYPSSEFPLRPTRLLMPKELKDNNIQSLLLPEFQSPQLVRKGKQHISQAPLMVAGMMFDNRISQTTGPGWGILILSFPTSNFQCLCSVEPLSSFRAEQMPVLMDLLNHKNCLQNCI